MDKVEDSALVRAPDFGGLDTAEATQKFLSGIVYGLRTQAFRAFCRPELHAVLVEAAATIEAKGLVLVEAQRVADVGKEPRGD